MASLYTFYRAKFHLAFCDAQIEKYVDHKEVSNLILAIKSIKE